MDRKDIERLAVLENKVDNSGKLTQEIHDAILGQDGLAIKCNEHGVSIRWLTWGERALFCIVAAIILFLGVYFRDSAQPKQPPQPTVPVKQMTAEEFIKLHEGAADLFEIIQEYQY